MQPTAQASPTRSDPSLQPAATALPPLIPTRLDGLSDAELMKLGSGAATMHLWLAVLVEYQRRLDRSRELQGMAEATAEKIRTEWMEGG